MSQPARWLPDPYGRFQQRYFDGEKWTAHVITNGDQSVDPLGTTVSIPFAAPTIAPTVDTTGPTLDTTTAARSSIPAFLDSLGPDARTRPGVHLSTALAGVGGLVTAAGIATAIVGNGDTNRIRNIIAAVVVVGIAYAIRLGVKTQVEARAAAVGAAALGIPGLAVALTNTDPGGGTAVLAAVLLVAAWTFPGMRGRPLLLGESAVALVLALATFGGDNSGNELFDLGPANLIGGESWLFVLTAVAFLAMVWWLDSQGFHGVGTSLVVAAVLATAFAVIKVVETLTSTSGAVLLAVAGLAVALVGDHGHRRATTWFGVAVAAIGTVATFASALTPNSTGESTSTLILAGLALVVVPLLIRAIRASRAPHPGV